ncbi:hypothetical protein BC830DRAFT_1118738 [Chytriomyces sp. MP71]|nr:hypothetical protein BC830DRAFT_1118738 [Chytriomyces sp. MP71]
MPQISKEEYGGFSFLVSSITGPGIPLIPSLYQTAGWLLPTVLFLVIGGMSALACLFLIESMTYFPGNKYFERNVEFTVLVHHFYGKRWYYFMHVILYGSLQSFIIASIIQAVQNFDTFVLSIAGQTCGFRYSPTQDIFCVNQVTASNSSGSPFGTNGMLITAGGLIFGGIIGPLMQLNLDDNMIIQWVSIMYVILVVIFWAIMCFVKGVQAGLMPSVGSGIRTAPTSVIAQVMFNFTLANTVPSWINTRNKKVNIHKCVFFSCYVACGVYVFTGIFGGLAFPVPSGANLLSVQSAYFSANGPNVMYGLANFISLTFPILILITSIPVAFIIVKLNLITSHICSKDWATFYGQILPFIVCVPFQTGPYMVYFTNWSSIIFQSMCNFMAPYLIFIFLDQRNTVMAQSVIDELENLDLDGAGKKEVL